MQPERQSTFAFRFTTITILSKETKKRGGRVTHCDSPCCMPLPPCADLAQKSPLSALLAVGIVVGGLVGTKVTLDAMLGLSDQVQMASDGFM